MKNSILGIFILFIISANSFAQESYAPHERELFPRDVTFYNTRGQSVNIEDYRGKVIYIDVWASWCLACFTKFPYIDELQDTFEEDEFVVLMVSIDKTTRPWKNFHRRNDVPGISLHGGNDFQQKVMDKNFMISIPAYMLIDKQGRIADTHTLPPNEVWSEVYKLLEEDSSLTDFETKF